jgi:hypothetical protein
MRFVLIIAALLCAHGITAYAEIQQDVVERDTIGGTGGGGGGDLSSIDIDTFSELDAIVADEGLVNLNDAQTLLNKVIDGNSNTVKMLRHATDCTSYTGAVDGQYCWEQDTDTLYVCETADECDTAGEWDAVASGGGGATELSDLDDAEITSVQNGQVLVADTGVFVNVTPPFLSNAGDLDDGEICVWNLSGLVADCNVPTSTFEPAGVTASEVTNTPAGDIEGDTVQEAIDELSTEKLSTSAASSTYFPISGGVFGGDITLHAQSLTIADSGDGNPAADSATTITGNDLYVTCSDTDGCNLTLSEADPINNRMVRVVNISANTVELVHSSGVAEMCAAANVALAQKDDAYFQYRTDEWNQLCTQTDWSQLANVPAFRKTLIQLRPQSNQPPASSFATINTRNSIPVLRFNGNVCAVWGLQMPNTYGGNGVTVRFEYTSTETTNDTDWDGSWRKLSGVDIDTATFASAVSSDNNNNNGTSGIATIVTIAFTDGAQMNSCGVNDWCEFRICRDDTGDTGGADTTDFGMGAIMETP